MRKVEIIGYKRANLGKTDSKRLRTESQVPCVLYGGKEQVHFSAPMILFRDVVYTPEPAFVKLNIEGEIHNAILQDIQFHPVNEIILHADFLELADDKLIKMDIPIKFTGKAPGVIAGGKLLVKLRKVTIKAVPGNMPESISMDISGLSLGKSLKVSNIEAKDFEILNNPRITIATVEIPRTLKAGEQEEEEEEATAETAEAGEE
ncbi:MAG: 50S ribosomal protein L25/general stress protein Ctc [Cyclobacteriaceae bacterium]|nr:50S ribosomal protein L25/general stress protein Ctc [Cyclobacteriaceae bacterium]